MLVVCAVPTEASEERRPNLAKERTDSDALAVLVLAVEHEPPSRLCHDFVRASMNFVRIRVHFPGAI